ncbi:MAG: N-acetyltransferase [Myxococcales bacterium]|nr:MAG: N-acetyltransferase [Myxococcales bacterium]
MSESGVRAPRIHATAIVEPGVEIGPGTSIWDSVHVRGPARIGSDCIVGEKTYIAYDVHVGDYVKINSFVYVCSGVTIEDRVMIAAGVVFTNDRFPRAFVDGHEGLAPSEPNDETLRTTVREGATLGARSVIGAGLELGAYCMIGMGSVVTADVPAHGLVYGNPARLMGHVCVCGARLPEAATPACSRCDRRFARPTDRAGALQSVSA